MRRENSTRAVAWLPFLLLIGLSWGQNKPYQTFDWRPLLRSKPTSLHYEDTTQSSYDSRYFHTNPEPLHGSTGYNSDSSKSYDSNDSGHYSADSYSSDFAKSQPYQEVPYHYPDDSGSYEQYGYANDNNFNITIERYGGFGGTGDTRGFGAYDFPKKVHDVPQHLHEDSYGIDETRVETEFPDLLRIGRSRNVHHRRRNSMHVHPLPPPL